MILELRAKSKRILQIMDEPANAAPSPTNSSSTSPFSASNVETLDCPDDATLLYQILHELHVLKEIVTNMIKRQLSSAPNSESAPRKCDRSTQTERAPQEEDGFAKAVNLIVANAAVSPGKRCGKNSNDSTRGKQVKSSRSNVAAATSGRGIEQAVAKIKAIRSEKRSSSVSLTPATLTTDVGGGQATVAFPAGHLKCSSQTNPMANMFAAAVSGCYPTLINGEPAIMPGMLPFASPMLDLLSTHCPFGEVTQASGDFGPQPSKMSAFHEVCHQDVFGTADCKSSNGSALAGGGSSTTHNRQATVSLLPKANHNKMVADASRAQKSFGADYYKPYACQHANCNKRFANKFLLKKHEFIHTGERPHQCPYCCKRFNRKDNLLRHKKTHESNNVLVKRTVRPSNYSQSKPVDEVNTSSASLRVTDSSPEMPTVLLASYETNSAIYDELDEEEEEGEELIRLKQESTTSEECERVDAVRLTPGNNLLLSAVTSKTTSTSQLPIATSFGVTN